MKSIVRAALAAALLGATGVATLPNTALAADHLSKELVKPISAVQDALKKNDYATALASIKDAQAVTDRTPYDDYIINAFLAQIYINQKDYTNADTPLEAAADSPALPDEQKKATYLNAFQLSLFAKHYDKVVKYGQLLQTMNALDFKTQGDLAIAYFFLKDSPHAVQYAQLSIDGAKAAGQQPDENMQKILMNAAVAKNDTGSITASLENLAVQYNDAGSWSKLVDLALNTKGIKELDELFLLRLKFMVPESMRTEDYTGLASVANVGGYSTEAYNVLQKGIAAGKVTAHDAGPTFAQAKSGAAADARDLKSIASQAERAKTGESDIKLAEDYWGYGRFADAEASARRAISKGGIKDPNEGPMLLGMVLVAEGKFADGQQELSQVGGSAARRAAAHLWSLYAQAQLKAQSGAAQTTTSQTPPAH